jgi:hypothetical protein
MKMNLKQLMQEIGDKHADLIFNLYERWLSESKYEDINDYLKLIQKSIPAAYAITKRPFGIKLKADDGCFHLIVKRSGNSAKLMIKKI